MSCDAHIEGVAVVEPAGDEGLCDGSACVQQKPFAEWFEGVEVGRSKCIDLVGHGDMAVDHHAQVPGCTARVGSGS